MTGKAYLVGAGPGRADLITVRGQRLLHAADVVIYDHLVGDDLLAEIPATAERIYVGKEQGAHTLPQDTINELIVDRVRQGRQVVRLKGGDPYVFGRGGEEALALHAAGLAFEVVPGVTSAIAVPAAAGIPVTHRGLAGGFAVVSGRTRTGSVTTAAELARYARVPTLVVLMGLSAVEAIVHDLIEAGRDPEEPAAAIARGATNEQRVAFGTLRSLPDVIAAARLERPVTLVLGEVVGLAAALGPRPTGAGSLT